MSIFKFKTMTQADKVDFCLKWFKITLMFVAIQATLKIIETIILLSVL